MPGAIDKINLQIGGAFKQADQVDYLTSANDLTQFSNKLKDLTSILQAGTNELGKFTEGIKTLSSTLKQFGTNNNGGTGIGGNGGAGNMGIGGGLLNNIPGRLIRGAAGAYLLYDASNQAPGTRRNVETVAGATGIGSVFGLPGALATGIFTAIGTGLKQLTGGSSSGHGLGFDMGDIQDIIEYFRPSSRSSGRGRGRSTAQREVGLTTEGAVPLMGAAQNASGGLQAMFTGMVSNLMTANIGNRIAPGYGSSMALGTNIIGQLSPRLGQLTQVLPGFISGLLNQSQQYLDTALRGNAQIASVAQFGGNRRDVMRIGLPLGFGPSESSQVISGINQSMGGEVSTGTTKMLMQMQRRYGVDTGTLGGGIGQLLQMGGTSMMRNENRDQMAIKIVTEGVAAGFGRRMPEFMNAISTSMRSTFEPFIMTDEELSKNILGMTSLIGATTRGTGLGVSQTQRMIQPFIGAPGQAYQNFMRGGGDPYTMSQLWHSYREEHQGDPWRMIQIMRDTSTNMVTPQGQISEQGTGFWNRMLGNAQQNSGGNRSVGLLNTLRTLQGFGYSPDSRVVENVYDRYTQAVQQAGGNTLTPEAMQQVLTGVNAESLNTQRDTNEILGTLQSETTRLMTDQLGALQALAGNEAALLAAANKMLPLAQAMFTVQNAGTMFLGQMMAKLGGTTITRETSREMRSMLTNLNNIDLSSSGGMNQLVNMLTSSFNALGNTAGGGNIVPPQHQVQTQPTIVQQTQHEELMNVLPAGRFTNVVIQPAGRGGNQNKR
ncbi:MAG: hypothetical protein WC144_05025 [Sulfurimonas sp.]|jgi:hypothetical protein